MPRRLVRDLVNEADSTFRTSMIIFVYLVLFVALGEATGMMDFVNSIIGGLKLFLLIGVPFGVIALISFIRRNFR